jgi:hypothetical protein
MGTFPHYRSRRDSDTRRRPGSTPVVRLHGLRRLRCAEWVELRRPVLAWNAIKRQTHDNGSSFAWLAGELDCAAVLFHDATGTHQDRARCLSHPQARSVRGERARKCTADLRPESRCRGPRQQPRQRHHLHGHIPFRFVLRLTGPQDCTSRHWRASSPERDGCAPRRTSQPGSVPRHAGGRAGPHTRQACAATSSLASSTRSVLVRRRLSACPV